MFDDIKDFVKSFTDRLSSPLFGSFAVSWLLINYEIPITLIFYKQDELIRDGYPSFLNVIWQHSNWWKFGWLPLICSISYVIGYPWIRNGFSALHAMADSWGGNVVLKATKGQKVDISKFIQIREQMQKDRKRLEDLYEEDAQNLRIIGSLNDQMIHQKGVISELQNKIDKIEIQLSGGYFNGEYKASFNSMKGLVFDYLLLVTNGKWIFRDIDNGKVYQINSGRQYISPEENDNYTIVFFQSSAALPVYETPLNFKFIIFQVPLSDSEKDFEGKTDSDIHVRLMKIDQPQSAT